MRRLFAGHDLIGKRFGGPVETIEVIGAIMKKVADFLVGQENAQFVPTRRFARNRLFEELCALAGAAESHMQAQKGVREPRRVGGNRLQIPGAWRDTGKQRICQSLFEIMDQVFGVFLGKFSDVDRKGLGQAEQNRGCDRTLVVFDLVQIAG